MINDTNISFLENNSKISITSSGPSPSTNQGKQFKKYQNKIISNLEKEVNAVSQKEGFTGIDGSATSLYSKTNDTISKNDPNKQNIDNLTQEYNITLKEYEDLLAKIATNTTSYINRVDPNNPYLNKVIRFKNGKICYVTNQGVVKYIPSREIWRSLNIPQTVQINLDIPYLNSYQTPRTPIPTNPPLISGTNVKMNQSFGNEGSNIYVNEFLPEDTKASYIGCYASGPNNDNMTFIGGSTDSSGNYTYESCKQAAIEEGYQYFALQNVNNATSKGYCVVTNSSQDVKKYGNAKIPIQKIVLWQSNTSGQPGNTAYLSATGSLQVLNSTGKSLYSSPSINANPSNYLGCYGDGENSSMVLYNNGSKQYNLQQCQQIAKEQKYSIFGLQDSTTGTNAQCALGGLIEDATKFGTATNCTKLPDGSWSGGGLSNALYMTSLSVSNYFLILQDDGNLCIYRGTNPYDNQGLIWSSETNGKQKQSNPEMVATKGKYGKNWISSGSTLAPGDFISSNKGDIALVMQSDGNLVLYTYKMGINCKKMADGNIGGGVNANATYNLIKSSVPENMGKLGYIDDNAELYSYPSNNTTYDDSYTNILNGYDTLGNDIPEASFVNSTLETCKQTCNKNPQCAGIVTNADGTVCFPKTSGMYPFGGKSTPNSDRKIYVRNKQPKTVPIGVSTNTNLTDTYTYNNYADGGALKDAYGLANINSIQKQQLDQLKSKLNMLSKQMGTVKENFTSGSNTVDGQTDLNVKGIKQYLQDIKNTNKQSKLISDKLNGGLVNILNDSDIIVLQKNYDYLFWSILAAGTVLVSMNIVKYY
jgi:hypothetical protein